jgi:hypothetical protein
MRKVRRTWTEWAFIYLYTFRIVVVSSCVVLAAVGWLAQIQWLSSACGCIAIGEFVESTYYIVVLKWARKSGRLPMTA